MDRMDNRSREGDDTPLPSEKEFYRFTEKKETEMGMMAGKGSYPKVD